MKIKGVWGEFDAPYVRALFICSKSNLKRYVEFLIDSGASRTTILDNDAVMLGIDYNQLEKFDEGTMGIGGAVDTYIIPEVSLIFKTITGIHEENFSRVFVLKHAPRNEEEEEKIRRIPSLLGRDILNRYSLFLNKKKEVVIISDEDE